MFSLYGHIDLSLCRVLSIAQAGATSLAIARALQHYEPTYRRSLKYAGLLMRDPRKVERKKPGQAKARKRYQWVKR
jgi:small subunit ribosomal protein S9